MGDAGNASPAKPCNLFSSARQQPCKNCTLPARVTVASKTAVRRNLFSVLHLASYLVCAAGFGTQLAFINRIPGVTTLSEEGGR
jgi:hypothetical protein